LTRQNWDRIRKGGGSLIAREGENPGKNGSARGHPYKKMRPLKAFQKKPPQEKKKKKLPYLGGGMSRRISMLLMSLRREGAQKEGDVYLSKGFTFFIDQERKTEGEGRRFIKVTRKVKRLRKAGKCFQTISGEVQREGHLRKKKELEGVTSNFGEDVGIYCKGGVRAHKSTQVGEA